MQPSFALPNNAPQDPLEQWLLLLLHALQKGELLRLTVSKSTLKQSELTQLYGRALTTKGELRLSFNYRYKQRDETHHFSPEEGIARLRRLAGNEFLDFHLFTTTGDYTLRYNNKRKPSLIASASTAVKPPPTTHDREKQRKLSPESSPWMRDLGLASAESKILKEAKSKYTQVNHYLELLDELLQTTPQSRPLRVVDMGAGKGYLTFALYQYLTQNLQRETQITGIELRPNLVQHSNQVAKDCGYEGLAFEVGDISSYPFSQALDLLIALHACDTATDEALFQGIRSQTPLLVCAPCCHKQVRKALSPPEALRPLLRHGILLERQAEMLTDGLRALLLETQGYQTKVIEFVSVEHTPKNLMIIAVLDKNKANPELALERIAVLKATFGLSHHHLEDLLHKAGLLPLLHQDGG